MAGNVVQLCCIRQGSASAHIHQDGADLATAINENDSLPALPIV